MRLNHGDGCKSAIIQRLTEDQAETAALRALGEKPPTLHWLHPLWAADRQRKQYLYKNSWLTPLSLHAPNIYCFLFDALRKTEAGN